MAEVEDYETKDESQAAANARAVTDEAILAQMEQIKTEIAEAKSLIGNMEDVSVLRAVYDSKDTVYQQKIQHLMSKYSKVRQIRPDGNCFFRAVSFAYLERLIHDPSDYAR
ncbi:ubiquitin thioesterase OTUB1-like [Corticium candelabrum]|uniref:ubiquitin thioesterase OTUB1-like n=1 Tax=Corticium candelabrum TaxID=121492 RepID=UPI002E2532A7|nr:ubiquitin thioesterase OTUB1-like [Corticium candelabrum]